MWEKWKIVSLNAIVLGEIGLEKLDDVRLDFNL